MKICTYTFVAFQLNGALGSGRYNDITIEKIKEELISGHLFKYLEIKLGDDLDLSLLNSNERKVLLKEWREIMEANIDPILCVEKNGLSLLIAYILDCIQRIDAIQRAELEKL